jgi:hypothetical protein
VARQALAGAAAAGARVVTSCTREAALDAGLSGEEASLAERRAFCRKWLEGEMGLAVSRGSARL